MYSLLRKQASFQQQYRNVRLMSDSELIARFKREPEQAYTELLERFSPIILRMIYRFMRDPDEVMEVYTSICERFRANDYQALRRFRINSELTPWLSVVVANACRDRFRKKRVVSMPQSVIDQLNTVEKLVFRYYFQERMAHEDISETISSKHRTPCTALDVVDAISKINGLLSTSKRWHLLSAMMSNTKEASIDELSETGFQPAAPDDYSNLSEALPHQEQLEALGAALKSLEHEDRLLVHLRFEHGMTAPQIADAMQYESHKYVYTRLRTVVNRLRRMLEGSQTGEA